VNLPEDLITLLRQPSACFLATMMPDGSPQMTRTWVDTDGEHVVINTVQGHQKVRNVERDPRVAVSVCDVSSPVIRSKPPAGPASRSGRRERELQRFRDAVLSRFAHGFEAETVPVEGERCLSIGNRQAHNDGGGLHCVVSSAGHAWVNRGPGSPRSCPAARVRPHRMRARFWAVPITGDPVP